VSCADAVVTVDSAAPSTTMAPVHARSRQIVLFVWSGIFDIAHVVRSASRQAAGRQTE
jgi:hypothetical protein